MNLQGIDVSSHQRPDKVGYNLLRKQGISFVFARLSMGLTGVDTEGQEHIKRAKDAGIPFLGAYHLFRATSSPKGQADHFLEQMALSAMPLVPMLDIETRDGSKSTYDIVFHATECMEYIVWELGRLGLFYTYPAFISPAKLPDGVEKIPLWIAHYGVSAPRIPKPWKKATIWQYDGDGGKKLPGGIDGDFNLFYGTEDNFRETFEVP